MFNKSLLKKELKSGYIIGIIIILALTVYCTAIVWMYGAYMTEVDNQQSAMNDMLGKMPELSNMFGFNLSATGLVSFLASYLYGMILLVFPMIYSIAVANRLVTKYVEKGSMAYLLASPNSRLKIISTQMLYNVLSTTAILLYAGGLIVIESAISYPGKLEFGKFAILHFGLIVLHFMLSGIFFAVSCFSNESKKTIGICTSIGVGFFLLQMLSGLNQKLEFLKYFSIFTLFDPNGLIEYKAVSIIMVIIMSVVGVFAYVVGINRFKNKDLSI